MDFIVDDYDYYDDPDYVPEKHCPSDEEDKYVVSGKEFKKLTKNAIKLGAATRKNNKYMATLSSGKKVHFGSPNYPDYLIHEDKDRRDRYLARAKKIKNILGELTYTNPKSANYWSVNLL